MITLINIINSINTAIALKKNKIYISKLNNLSLCVLKILKELNIIEFFKIDAKFKTCSIVFNTITNNVYLSKIIAMSKPNRYIYYSVSDLIKLRNSDLFNDYLIFINDNKINENNIVTIDDAIHLHKGGLLLLKIIKTL